VIDYRTTGARLDEYFKEMRAATSDYPNLYFVGEGWGMPRERIVRAVDDRNKELSSAFRFDFMLQNIQDGWRSLPWSLQRLKDFNKENQFDDDPHVWPIVFIEDHDFSRSVSRFGSSRPEYKDRSAKLLATMLLSLRGTPLIYQGEEIGMSNFPFTAVSQYNDIGVYNLWKDLVETGKVPAAEYLAHNALTSRDNSRTPMQWDASPQAGFTTNSRPWLAVNPNYLQVNVESEAKGRDSVLSFYRDLIRIRKSKPTLIFGSYRDISEDHPHLYAYERSGDSGTLLVLLNFSDEPTEFRLPVSFKPKAVVVNNVAQGKTTLSAGVSLLPWQALIFE
jgi:oligo-1,6-glucosidase